MITEQIMPGDKVDIRVLQQVKQDKADNKLTTLVSSVFDVDSDGTVELNMPSSGGRIILLSTNLRYEFVFTTAQGLYKANGVVQERYKENNFFLAKIAFTTPLVKFQRREYYRLSCMLPLDYLVIDDSITDLNTMKEVHYALSQKPDKYNKKGEGTMLDISGGGLRFVTKTPIHAEYLLMQFNLENEKRNEFIDVIGFVIRSEKLEESSRYFHRIKFIFKDTKCQEHIIKYIFEEERIIRKKEQG